MKKYRLKKKPVVILVLIIIVVILIFKLLIPKYKVKIDNIVVYQDKIDYEIYYRNKNITENCQIKQQIDTSTLGKKKIKFLCDKKEIKATVKVIDNVAPTITLKQPQMKILLNTEYEDPGYEVIDNYDKDIKVKVENNININKEGVYEVKYTAKDKSGNITEVIRKVTVTNTSPLAQSIKEFSLDGYFDEVKIQETELQDDEYVDKFIYVGDSIPLYYVITGHISGRNLWHKEGLSMSEVFEQEIYINHQESGLTIPRAFEEYKPKAAIFNLGMNSVSSMSEKYFIDEYTKLITKIKEVSPNTVIIINSIPPVAASYDENEKALNNDKINKFNYYIAQMCNKLNIYYLDSAQVLKDENGQCKAGYYLDQEGSARAHQTKEGNDQIFNYIKTHSIKLDNE